MMSSHPLNEQSALPISPASSNTINSAIEFYQHSPVQTASPNASSAQPMAQPADHRFPDGNSSYATGSLRQSVSTNAATPEDTVRKKRRSRKGLSKRFECSAEGCGKAYSRAEHLYRHQLNHNSKQVFHCEYPGCSRTFVRVDLLKRHMDRHAAKGFHAGHHEPSTGQASQEKITSPASSFTESHSAAVPGGHQQAQPHYVSPQESNPSPYTPAGNSTPSGNACNYTTDTISGNQRALHGIDAQLSGPSQVATQATLPSYNGTWSASPGSGQSQIYIGQLQNRAQSQNSVPFTPNSQPLQLDMSHSHYPCDDTVPTSQASDHVYSGTQTSYLQHGDIINLDHMVMPIAGPVFGDEGGLSKSPYAGMPEDFMAYLFNSLPSQSSPSTYGFQGPGSNYGELQDTQYSIPFMANGIAHAGHFPTASQHIMSVSNLLDENSPETNISDERSREIFDFIKDRFHEHDVAPAERSREGILEGNRDQANHMLSRRMMQTYLSSYWYHFSDQLPILHRPTFSSDKVPNLLLLAMLTIGAACLDRTHGQQVLTAGAKLSNFIARHLRWEVFMDRDFRPPAKLWVFQTLILLELYEKMFSTRELHERAHIHHATMITLMRRGRSLTGNPSADSPPNQQEVPDGCRQAPGARQTSEEWWNHWIANEATRRAAFAAFIIDSTHAAMFGHSAVMATHEMRLPLPCDESLWSARSSAEVLRAEAGLKAKGIRPISFLEGLKRTLSHQEVRATPFGRTALMAGLLSVTYHMHQRDLQANVLGGGVIQALGGRDKWRAALTRAYDSWKSDFDRGLGDNEPSNDPYGHRSTRNEAHVVFGSRTVLHHLAHMAMHADIVDCQMFARAKRLLGRTIGTQEFGSAQKRVKEQWAPSAKARDATFYALKLLSSVLLPDGAAPMNTASPWPKGVYETRYDVLMNRPWVLYFAALVVWCYGYALEGPCGDVAADYTPEEIQQQTKHYLLRFGRITNPNELLSMRGINNNTALLVGLRNSFDDTRWDLLHEGAYLLRNCIVLNSGGTV